MSAQKMLLSRCAIGMVLLAGGQKYYFSSKGTYKAGRKDCDVAIQNDRGVSRIHAEIIIDAMTSRDPAENTSDSFLSSVRIKDLAKYGTFINKGKESKAVNELPNKVKTLKNGDQISFGTGASSTSTWNTECTHVIADDSTSVTERLICAIVAQKPVIRSDWIKYVFGGQLKSLLATCSAEVVLVDEYCLNSQTGAEANNSFVLVCPKGSLNEFPHVKQLISLPRVNDVKLVAGVLSGHFDPSIVELPSITVSSQSTDETIVADSDAETDTAVSDSVVAAGHSEEVVKPEEKKETFDHAIATALSIEAVTYNENEASKNRAEVELDGKFLGFKVDSGGMIERTNKGDESGRSSHENSDIIYSQDLIVRYIHKPAEVPSTANTKVINFKQFRKKETPSGNSFKDLIPFSKDPFKESDLGNEEVAKYVREEKKRKQLEAVAEDLFNIIAMNESLCIGYSCVCMDSAYLFEEMTLLQHNQPFHVLKAKRRAAAGLSIRALLGRG
ncbi:Mre11 complex subunit Nbs1 [Asimina triloba]